MSNPRNALLVVACALLVSSCSISEDHAEGDHSQGELVVGGVELRATFQSSGEYLTSPWISAGEPSSRAAFMLDVDDASAADRVSFEARGVDAQGVEGPWSRTRVVFEEGANLVLVADLAQATPAFQFRLTRRASAHVRMLTFAAGAAPERTPADGADLRRARQPLESVFF